MRKVDGKFQARVSVHFEGFDSPAKAALARDYVLRDCLEAGQSSNGLLPTGRPPNFIHITSPIRGNEHVRELGENALKFAEKHVSHVVPQERLDDVYFMEERGDRLAPPHEPGFNEASTDRAHADPAESWMLMQWECGFIASMVGLYETKSEAAAAVAVFAEPFRVRQTLPDDSSYDFKLDEPVRLRDLFKLADRAAEEAKLQLRGGPSVARNQGVEPGVPFHDFFKIEDERREKRSKSRATSPDELGNQRVNLDLRLAQPDH